MRLEEGGGGGRGEGEGKEGEEGEGEGSVMTAVKREQWSHSLRIGWARYWGQSWNIAFLRLDTILHHNGFIFAVAVGEGEDNFLSKNLFYRYLHTIEYI